VPVSISRHLDKLSDTLSKYGFEGCGVLTAGLEGLRAALAGGVEIVLQPVTLASNASSTSTQASLTGGGQPASVVSARLTRPLQPESFSVRRGKSCDALQFRSLGCMSVSLPVAGSESRRQREHQGQPQARVEEHHVSTSSAAFHRPRRSA
jgi:hypothetical protein